MIGSLVGRPVGLLLWLSATALASPALNGPYSGDLGVIQFSTKDGRVSGHYQKGGACPFQPDRRLIEGLFEGNVLAGTVTLCQAGAACGESGQEVGERTYPFLAFYNERDGALAADVKLEPGCDSPALKKRRLLLTQIPGESVAAPEGPKKKGANSRAANAALARAAFEAGHKAVSEQRYEEAKRQFERLLSFEEKSFEGYFGLGEAESKLGHSQAALQAFDRVVELNGDFADAYFSRACVHAQLGHKREALADLDRAVRRGFDEPGHLANDPDLIPIRAEPEYQALLEKMRARAHRHGKRP